MITDYRKFFWSTFLINMNMCENLSDFTNNINHRKYYGNKNRKRIFIFTKNDPHGKMKRILFIGSSHTKINQTLNNEIELENVLELDLKPRTVVTSPQFQPIEKKSANRRNKLRISSNDGKALSHGSLKISGNLNHYRKFKYTNYNSGHFKANYKVYRCQISTNQEACCCSCNSDAMFEVMKSLYDCYKKKNCDNCNCFLCGRWPRVERGPSERQKMEIEGIEKVESKVTSKKEKPLKEKDELEVSKTIPETKSQIGVGKALAPKEAAVSTEKLKEKTPDLLRILETTPKDQKEKIIKEAVLKGIPIPEAKTTSEKKIIDKIKKDVGLPPKPKSPSKKAKYENALNKGLITPLEGKTASQKEKILRGQANLGLKLPEGRTSSEQILIAKIQSEAKATKKIKQLEKKTAKSIEESKGPSDECICSLMTPIVDSSDQKIVSAHKIKKEKELGTISPLQGKTKSQKEKVFKGMALQGTALPEGKTASEKDLLDNVRKSLGLPPAPKTPALRQKYKEATAAGVITPLKGKTAKQKEKILREQAALGIPLPEGRTASEKSLVAKIKAVAPPLSDIPVPSKILKKAKDTGLLTPIKGKTREEKENILTGLAMHGVPLPEVRTASEKKIVDKIHANLGLPPPPVSSAAKEKYLKAYADGLIVPLEGKTASQKEKILQNQANIGLALPVGRTSSEKVLIEKAKGKAKEFAPIQQLKGKPPKQKEKILKGLAMNGILLPEAKSPSEKKIIDKVRDDLGLPPEPTSDSEKRAYKQSIATGDIAPLEGKSPMQKEKILRNVAKMGLKLPTGRTPSEKDLVAKVLATKSTMPLLKPPSVEMERKAKRSVLTRLEGKPPEHKEKILKELAIRGIPLPEARTASEKKLIDKVRKDVAFPLTKPVKGLPEGQLVTSDISEVRLPSQVVQKAKAAGLLTPLKGKKKEQKENILKGLAMNGIPLPEAKTPSEQKLIENVQKQLGLPPVPEEPSEKKKYTKAIISGQIAPLEGKTPSQKEDIIKNQVRMGLNIPVGRTPSEKAIIDKAIQSEIRIPSQVLKKAKDAGLLTPLKGKKKNEKESILRGLAMNGIPLPEAKTSSENKIIEKVREELGLPPEPTSPTEKAKYKKALISGQIAPLEGKSSSEKEKIIKNQMQMGLKLPKGRTSSEKSLINEVIKGAAAKKPDMVSPQKLKKAIDTSMIVPLEGKTKEEKEKFLTDLALRNIPLPEARTASDKKIIQKVQADVGLPPQPKTSYEKEQYKNALAQGYIAPLQGKTLEQKEKLLRNQAAMGLTLPKGRTSSEKDLIAKIKKNAPKAPKSREKLEKLKKQSAKVMKEAKGPSDQCICGIISYDSIAGRLLKEGKGHSEQVRLPSQLFKKAKEAGLLTPLEGKKKEQKEKILKGLAMNNIPLPIAKSPSENKIIEKVREDLGLPPVPKAPSEIEKFNKAIISGEIAPLEGKTTAQKEEILKNQLKMGFNLPIGRTSSEKALIDKFKGPTPTPLVPESKSLMVPLEGKTKEEKEKILKDLALRGIPLPKAETASDKNIIHKVQTDVGLPPPPKTSYEKEQYKKALAQGFIVPLEGKTAEQKEKLLRNQAAMGLTLPKGRTSSEKALISKIKKATPKVPKSREQLKKLETKSAKGMKEAKGPSDECICSIISSEVRTERPEVVKIQSEVRVPSEVLKKAKEAGLLTPLKGKKKEQKESILKGLAMNNIPLPEATSPSDSKIIKKVQEDLGLPPAPETPSEKEKYNRAIISGKIAPLQGKTALQKEDILRKQIKMGLRLPKGRTSSEKSLIDKVKNQPESALPSQILKKAKVAGLLTPLDGKKEDQKEKILKGFAMNNIPLPEAKTASEKKIIEKVREDLGLPPAPKSPTDKDKYNKAIITGQIAPLEGKNRSQKEEILKNQIKMGLNLPKGRTSSEKSLIAKIKKLPEVTLPTQKSVMDRATSEVRVPSEVLKKAKAAGLLTPLKGKKKKQKEAILKGLAMNGIPLPEAKTSSEKKIIEKVRTDMGLPPEPESPTEKLKYKKAIVTGKIGPLEGKTPSQKEDMIRSQLKMGLILPKGRTSSEKSLIDKVKLESEVRLPSKQLKRAKAVGLLTPLEGKSKEQKESILKGLAMNNIPLPEAKSPSENKILEKVRADIGLPPAPELPANKEKYNRAIISGQIAPLEGKTASQKENIIRNQLKLGLIVPKGRTASEMSLIDKVKKSSPKISKTGVTSIKSLTGKTKEEKEKIFKDLAMRKIPLPEAKTTSDKKIIEKVQADIGLPPQPKTSLEKIKYEKAVAKGYITPLEGKSSEQKEKILRKQAAMGIRLPKGRTSSEKALIAKINTIMPKTPKEREKIEKLEKVTAKAMKESKGSVDECICDVVSPVIEKGAEDISKPKSISEQIKKAVLLDGKPKHEKEKILKDLAMQGIALPEAKNKSEKKIIDKVRLDLGLPSEPKNEQEKQRYHKALTKGVLVPLEGKSKSQKEKILRYQAALGINLPKGRTPSEISMIEKVKKSTKEASKISITSESIKDLAGKPKKGMAAKYGISESIQEVTKETTCDKGCGCDTKKVKFKHSYVKIRITSPDMSSICPCPEECFPGVQGGVFTDNEGIKITVGRVVEISGFLHTNQEKMYEKFSMVTLNAPNTFINEENVERKITRSESYLLKNRKNEFNVYNMASTKSISESNPKVDESDDAASNILNMYNSAISSSLSSRIFEIDSRLSFVTPNSNSNKSLDVLHQCNRYFEDDVVDETINKFSSEINLKSSICESLNMLSDIYQKSSTIYFNSEVLVENVSQYLCALKSTRSDFQEHENYDSTLHGSTNFEQNVKENYIEDVLKKMVAKELISQSSSFIVIVPTSSLEISDSSPSYVRSSICIQVSKNCCYRNTPRNKNNGRIKKIEFKFSKDDVSLRPCSTGANKTLTKRDSAFQTRIQEIKKSRVISTDTTQDRPCCCDHAVSLGRSEDNCSTTTSSSCVDKSTSSNKSYTNTTTLMDMLKKTMSIACGTGEDISKVVKQKNKPKVNEQRTDLPCGCCSSSIEMSHYEICVDVADSKKKDKNASRSTSSTKNNVICQCPDESAAIDCDKYLKQVQSDLTQCTSGFKLKVLPQVSLENVLRYYANQAQSKTDCACSKRAQKNCECPAQENVEPFKGLKLHMEGKGSAAKGLNGFLCFELLDYTTPYQSFRIDSNSMLVSCSSNHES